MPAANDPVCPPAPDAPLTRCGEAGFHRVPAGTGDPSIVVCMEPPRAALIGPHRIRHRMAQDLRELAASQEAVTRDDLLAIGWTLEQIAAHGRAAMVLAEASGPAEASVTLADASLAETGSGASTAAEAAIDAQIAALAEIAATARSIAARVERDIADLQRRYGRPA
jgi:hypothetical protein